jgi:hypothetical protein
MKTVLGVSERKRFVEVVMAFVFYKGLLIRGSAVVYRGLSIQPVSSGDNSLELRDIGLREGNRRDLEIYMISDASPRR